MAATEAGKGCGASVLLHYGGRLVSSVFGERAGEAAETGGEAALTGRDVGNALARREERKLAERLVQSVTNRLIIIVIVY